MSEGRSESWTIVTLLGWGVFALGASRPWGYVPLLTGMAAFGTAIFLQRGEPSRIGRGLWFSLLSVCTAVFLQLIPLPASVLDVISPAMKLAGQGGPSTARPLSIDPSATARGLMFVLALGLFFVGMVKTLGRSGGRRLAIGLVGLAVLVAVIGIAESSTSWPGIYGIAGLRLPPDSTPLGPFSSKNHYVAWMLMAVTLTIAYLCALVEQSHRTNISRLLFVQCAAMVMAIALVQTRSRAGILGLALAVMTMCGLLVRRSATSGTRVLTSSLLGLLLLAGIVTTGAQPIISRFVVDSWSTAHGRLPIWQQAVAIAQDFPLTGSGFNTYQSVVPFYASADLDEPYEGAHNDYLQLTVEGGLLIGLPLLATVGFFIRETRQRFRESSNDTITEWLRIGAIVGLLLVAVQETVDFSLQVPGNAALFAVLAAIAIHRAPRERRWVGSEAVSS